MDISEVIIKYEEIIKINNYVETYNSKKNNQFPEWIKEIKDEIRKKS